MDLCETYLIDQEADIGAVRLRALNPCDFIAANRLLIVLTRLVAHQLTVLGGEMEITTVIHEVTESERHTSHFSVEITTRVIVINHI